MFCTNTAVKFAGSWQAVKVAHDALGATGKEQYDAILAIVLADDANFPSRYINDLVSYAWENALLP